MPFMSKGALAKTCSLGGRESEKARARGGYRERHVLFGGDVFDENNAEARGGGGKK